MKINFVGVLVLVFLSGFLNERSDAKDRLVIGYTAITGIKAGLWVAEDAGIPGGSVKRFMRLKVVVP